MVYTFFTRALLVLVGMIVVGFASYYLLAELFDTKQPNLVAKESFAEISVVEGVVKNIHLTPTTTPARIEVETPEGIVTNIVIQPSANCITQNIFDVTQLTAGDIVEVRGVTSKRGDVLPCEDSAHYFNVTQKTEPVHDEMVVEDVPPSDLGEVSNAMVFSGTLETFGSACFHDGECYVVLDGRKVTLLVGRSTQPVGEVLGVDLGVMQEYIGKRFEVYALSLGDDSYTLYGNTAFYIRPL